MKVLYLHGFLSSPGSTKAKHFARELKKKGLTIKVPDLNAPSFSTLTISRVVECAASILGPSDRGVVIGSSMGGWSALHFSSLYPERVAGLVLMAPAFNLPLLIEKSMGEEALESWHTEGVAPVEHPAYDDKQELGYGFLQDSRRWANVSPNVSCPVLIFHGTQDEDVPVIYSEEFAAGRSNVELVTYDCGHSLEEVVNEMIERSSKFIERLL